MLMEDRCRPDHEDSIQPTADTETEMDTPTKFPLRILDVLPVENFHISLANVQIGLTHRRHQRRKLLRPDSRMSDR